MFCIFADFIPFNSEIIYSRDLALSLPLPWFPNCLLEMMKCSSRKSKTFVSPAFFNFSINYEFMWVKWHFSFPYDSEDLLTSTDFVRYTDKPHAIWDDPEQPAKRRALVKRKGDGRWQQCIHPCFEVLSKMDLPFIFFLQHYFMAMIFLKLKSSFLREKWRW